MKKIFRMALVFALAGATLMYTGCTKDYKEEINKIDSDLKALQTDLTNKVNDLSNAVSELRSAYQAADDLIKGDVSDLQKKVKALEDAVKDLDKYATKDELKAASDALEKKISDAKEDIKKTTDDLQKQIDELKTKLAANEEALKKLEDAQKAVDAVYGFLSDELRSIVFYPDFYFGGVEATSYDFATFWGYKPKAITANAGVNATDHNDAAVNFPKGAKTTAEVNVVKENGKVVYYAVDKNTREYVRDDKGNLIKYDEVAKKGINPNSVVSFPYYPANFGQGQIGRAYYDLNPSSFPVDSAEWSLFGRDVNYIVKADQAFFWNPIFESISKVDGGLAEVLFTIDQPENVFASIIYAWYGEPRGAAQLDEYTQADYRRSLIRMYTDYLLGSSSHLPTMQLRATLSDGREIASDWHALSAGEEFVDHLAFSADNKWVTNYEYDCNAIYGPYNNLLVKDLYESAHVNEGVDGAVENKPSVQVQYNKGPVDLAKLISIHTLDTYGRTYNAYTLEEFNEKYPSFSYKFELVPYKIGGNITEEQMYGKISGTNFIPCYVESKDGKAVQHEIEAGSEDKLGISSVGRMPIVLAYLVNDETGESYAVGYFKIEIVKEVREADERFLPIPDLGTVPFICNTFTLKTNWHEFSYYVLETLQVDYTAFIEGYELQGIWGNELTNPYGDAIVPDFVEIQPATAGTEVTLTYEEPYWDTESFEVKTKTVNYGKAKYTQDASGSGINDAFSWKVNPRDIGEGVSKSIFFKFVNKADKYDIVYVEMNADVAGAAKFNFGSNKIANEWYADINEEPYNTGRINVLVPNATDDDVTEFYRDLNAFFEGKKPAMELTEDSDPVYKNYYANPPKSAYPKAELAATVVYTLSADQPVIKNICDYTDFWMTADGKKKTTDLPLLTNWYDAEEPYTKLYVPEYIFKNNKWQIETEKVEVEGEDDPVEVAKYYEKNLIATLTPDGVVTYSYAEGETAAKVLLNLWSYRVTDQANMLYANVHVDTFYGSCKIPAGDADFHMRFVRPIDIDFADADVAEESAVTGFNVLVAQFISGITDWNKMKVITQAPERDEDGKPVKDEDGNIIYTDYFEPNIINRVDMYAYYGFKTLTLDIENAERDHYQIGNPDARKNLFAVTPDALLQVGTVEFGEDDLGNPTEDFTEGSAEIDISDLENLKGACVHYENGRAVVETFNIYIPVTVEYAWGTITGELTIKVKPTQDTTPHSL